MNPLPPKGGSILPQNGLGVSPHINKNEETPWPDISSFLKLPSEIMTAIYGGIESLIHFIYQCAEFVPFLERKADRPAVTGHHVQSLY